MNRTAWVIAGGDFHAHDLDTAQIAGQDLVVGVDRGIEHCLLAGLIPDVLIGDFDSVEEAVLQDSRLADCKTIRHPVRKNNSDLELSLQWLEAAHIERVVLLGISGGRSDHLLFNWLLPMQRGWKFSIELVDKSVHAHVVNAGNPLHVPAQIGQTVSLLPMPEAAGVSTNGLEYALNNATLTAGTTLGLSNIAIAESVTVAVQSGQLLAFMVKRSVASKKQ